MLIVVGNPDLTSLSDSRMMCVIREDVSEKTSGTPVIRTQAFDPVTGQ